MVGDHGPIFLSSTHVLAEEFHRPTPGELRARRVIARAFVAMEPVPGGVGVDGHLGVQFLELVHADLFDPEAVRS